MHAQQVHRHQVGTTGSDAMIRSANQQVDHRGLTPFFVTFVEIESYERPVPLALEDSIRATVRALVVNASRLLGDLVGAAVPVSVVFGGILRQSVSIVTALASGITASVSVVCITAALVTPVLLPVVPDFTVRGLIVG